MAIKLIKACKELNIGMATLTAWCEKHGHVIESDPNVRIDDDLYLQLAKEFNKDMAVKIEADRLAAERIAREEAERQAAEEAKRAKEAAEAARLAAEKAAKEAQARAEAEKAAAEKAAADAKAAEESKAKSQEPTDNSQQPKKEIFTLGKPQLKHAPKVIGQIDLNAIDTSTRPAKKTKEQKRKEREERQQAQQAQNQAAAAERRKRERIKNNAAKVDPNDKRNQAGKKSKKNHPREATQEEVDKALKETLSRLSQKKGQSNTSKYKRERREQEREKQELERMEAQEQSKVLKLTEFVTANDLAVMMNVPVNKIIGTCMSLGLFVSINQRLDAETINLVAEEFGFQTEYVAAHVVEEINADEVVNEEDIEPRCPIITVMGHVDHGKTSLLDHIRNANVIAGEAGGITQHIGAYNVKLKNGRHITFLDTPGHAAFTAMRARGAKVTDIAIIIIAADDAVMPQTIEAINHAQAAGVPMVFAINKVDKPGANPDKIREQLSNMNILVEDWGGKYQCQEISAKKGTGVFELLEKVLLEADILDLKANPKRRAKGSVIESSLDKGRGYVATLLVQDGTLHMGDIVLAGTFHGRIKAMFNERGQKINEVHPGEPCSILGLNGAPQAGDEFNVLPTEQEARDIANKREQLQREQSIRTKKHVGLEEIGRRLAIGDFKELNIIVKADVDGSVEAIKDSLIKLSTENIQVNVIHGAVGAISDSDVMLAAASDAIIVGFNVRPTGTARKMAETEEVDIRIYSIIYDAINEVKAAMEGLLAPEVKEEVTATLEVLQTFHISKVGTIAGCIVREGKIKRGNKVRVIRDGIVIKTAELASLKHVKDDIKEAGVNTECGLSLKAYDDLKEGDILEAFEQIEVAKTL
jgi:translation initiation factor IF-2